jgi:outer membrane protein TolC
VRRTGTKNAVLLLAAVAPLAGCVPLAGETELAETLMTEGRRYERPPFEVEGGPLPELVEDSTLADYLKYGALNNPGLEAAFNRWKAAVERIPQAKALPDPRLNFGWFISEVETRVGPQRAKVGVSQMFPWRGKRALRGELALHAAEAAHARYEATKLRLFYKIERAYWEYWYLARAIAVTEENLKLLTYLEGVARTKFAAGQAPHSAVIKVQVEMGKLEDRLKALADMRRPRSANLDAALGRRAGEVLPWPKDEPPERDDLELSHESLLPLLLEQNPQLAAAEALVAREQAGIDLARRNYRPDVGLGLDYVLTGESLMGGADSGKDPVVAMFSMTLPFGKEKYSAAEREAEARHAAALLDRENQENGLAASLKLALFEFRDAGRKIDLYRDTLLPKARQSLDVARQAFEAGRADFLDIIDSERTLLEFDLSHARALADRAATLATIEMLVGKRVTRVSAGGQAGN